MNQDAKTITNTTSTSITQTLGRKNGTEEQKKFWRRAAKVTPKGVHSNFRYWGDDETPIIKKGKGSHIWDLDDNEYIDFRCGYGSVLIGHGDERICDAVNSAMRDGTVFTLSNPLETIVVEKMVKMCPCLEMVRFCNSGTEATMHAIRLARAYTGREKIIKFEGHFHGVHDYVLWSTAGAPSSYLGSKRDPIPFQMGSGIPSAIRNLIITLPFNDVSALERSLTSNGEQVAAIILETVMGNAAGIEATKYFLNSLRLLCDKYGIVLILDEVKTGFRISNGGAQEYYGIMPDLATYAKALGNGFPIAAFGGKEEIMKWVAPGNIYHGGTFCGNIVSMSAANAVLDLLNDGEIIKSIAKTGLELREGISCILNKKGMPHFFAGPPQMWGLLLSEKPVHEFRDLVHTDTNLYTKIMTGLINKGVMPEPDTREPWFVSASHNSSDVGYVLESFESVLCSL